MPRGRVKQPRPDLNQLADEAQAALEKLYGEGYEEEVTQIRAFIVAQGKQNAEDRKVSRDMVRDLSKRIPAGG